MATLEQLMQAVEAAEEAQHDPRHDERDHAEEHRLVAALHVAVERRHAGQHPGEDAPRAGDDERGGVEHLRRHLPQDRNWRHGDHEQLQSVGSLIQASAQLHSRAPLRQA